MSGGRPPTNTFLENVFNANFTLDKMRPSFTTKEINYK